MSSTKSRKPGQTRYREIERYLRTLVEGARPGAPLPSEAELCERFSVSRMTVRQALAELTNDGLVERRRGQGTFVAHRPVHRRPGVFLSFTEEMNRRGCRRPAGCWPRAWTSRTGPRPPTSGWPRTARSSGSPASGWPTASRWPWRTRP